ncbi:hypothetical protein HPB48_006522 [Haemaphysalis longicornis]|uniref:Cytochrome P450 n=1 Tax=Haemaphysalis longicornis TaxID=44386 RepID=A0A9J6H2U2_HAELO|nr:hypothetical protein HPB48_006522 [Haemaphysalis longicornis]
MDTINAQSFILATKLGKLSRTNPNFDVLPVVTMCTLDTICETVMGTTISAQTNENSPYVMAVHRTPRPFMDLLLLEHFKGNITEDGIREEVDTFMFAGHDTTATGISWALFLIGHHPEEQKMIHDELDSIFGDDKDRYVNTRGLEADEIFGVRNQGKPSKGYPTMTRFPY